MDKRSADAARDQLMALPAAPKTEALPIAQSLGRVLAEDIAARIPVPPFDRSPYDGYAFRGEDTASASRENPVVLKITEEIPAGKAPTVAITPGFAAKILTGAPVPLGANVTIKYENTAFTDDEVRFFAPVRPNCDIVKAGEDIAVGALLASQGDVIGPPHMGMLAGQGIGEILVYKKPAIAILNTGTELLEVGQPLQAAKIYNSNVYTLSGYLLMAGAEPVNAGVVVDDPEAISRRISDLLDGYDMVVTTGGASVGDYDWALRAVGSLGAEVLFWKCAMKPGGSMLAAVKDGKVILGLSGNPGAAANGLLKIGLPYIKKLCGRKDLLPETFEAIMSEPYKKKSPVTRLIRGRLEVREGAAYFRQTDGEGNGSVSPLLGSDLIGEIPEGGSPLAAGAKIKVFRI